jgi:hypothetical protein
MACFQNCFPDQVQAIEPAICSDLITRLSPDSFLHVQPWLIRREKPEPDSSLPTKELIHLSTHVPPGSIHIDPDRVSAELAADQFQACQEGLSVTRRGSHQPHSSQQRCDPAKDVQSFSVLARRWNPKPFSDLGPSHTQTRMQAKAGFIFKDHCLPRTQVSEFFLTPVETVFPPPPEPECRYNWPASVGTQADASTFEPAVPSALSRSDAPDASPGLDHPTVHDSSQIAGESSPGLPPASAGSLESIVLGVLGVFPVSVLKGPLCSPCASRGLSFAALGLGPRRSIPAAGPPVSAIKPRPLTLRALPGFPEQRPQDALGSPLGVSTIKLDFSYSQCVIT